MTVKERVIRESIDRINAEIKEIDNILDANPISEIIKIRQEAQKLLNDNQGVKARMSTEFDKKLRELSKREKQQFKLAEKQNDGCISLIERKSKLSFELGDLRSELYYIEMANKRR